MERICQFGRKTGRLLRVPCIHILNLEGLIVPYQDGDRQISATQISDSDPQRTIIFFLFCFNVFGCL